MAVQNSDRWARDEEACPSKILTLKRG